MNEVVLKFYDGVEREEKMVGGGGWLVLWSGRGG